MVILLHESDLEQIEMFKDSIEDHIKGGTFYSMIVEAAFGIENLLPEEILNLSKEISNIRLNEAYYNPYENQKIPRVKDGPSFVAASLGIAKREALKQLNDPKKVSMIFRSLREKLEDMEDRERRAKAENKGFLAMVVYTIRQALAWLAKTFADIKDYVIDSVTDRPEYAAKAKRDFKWISDYSGRYLANHTDWYDYDKYKYKNMLTDGIR